MEEGEGYVAFKGRQAKGVLYRLNAMPSRLMERMEKYVHGGIMAKDMRYARAVSSAFFSLMQQLSLAAVAFACFRGLTTATAGIRPRQYVGTQRL